MGSFLSLIVGLVIGFLGGWLLRGWRKSATAPVVAAPAQSDPAQSETVETPVAAAEPETSAELETPAEPQKTAEPETAEPEPTAAEPVAAEPVAAEPAAAEPIAADLGPAVPKPATIPASRRRAKAPAKTEPLPTTPEPVAATPEPVAVAAAPEPVAVAATPEPVAVAATPEPVAAEPAAAATITASAPVESADEPLSRVDTVPVQRQATPDTSAKPDNLTRIPGIGPKMALALNTAGISTFAALAASDEATIRAAISAAGLRFSPSLATWPEQAKLLAGGEG
jgi:predicted flap endonuclease-1-like 5' DNA nuclease